MKLLVVSAEYPGPDLIYGDTFVHARVKQYQQFFQVSVLGYNPELVKDRILEYEGVTVQVTAQVEIFARTMKEYQPDLIAVHLMQHDLISAVVAMGKPLFIFIHGYEALSWKRRLMNFTTFGDVPYLWRYILSNRVQLKAMKKLANLANQGQHIHYVFVSGWLKKAVEADWNMSLTNSHIIPNGIDTVLFQYSTKQSELRKKILLLRSFKSRNYANDLAVEAIVLLSKRDCFKELEFSIYGEGYLFTRLTEKLQQFPNVQLNNFFVENKNIPALHAQYGIFICPSRLDTQGVSMCEAMSSGLIPITSPVGGITEYSTDGISSFQVNTAVEIADKIEFLYHHPDVFLTMSSHARREIMNKCDIADTSHKEIMNFKAVAPGVPRIDASYRQCTRCILDTNDDTEIAFDESGVCSYCRRYEQQELKFVKKGQAGKDELEKVLTQIKVSGEGKPYDCLIGISGGVDSTYLALKAKEFGLRPLCVHFDNGWNSELAVNNIENIITKLGFDLHTFVVDWEEFRDLQLAFLKASVVDIELITDHAIITKLYQLALEYKIKYILSGSNVVTESVLPKSWVHDKKDHINIRAIYQLYSAKHLRTFPLFTSALKWRVEWSGVKSISLLDLLHYNKEEVKQIITKELGWRDYGGKHYESVFTRFYQGYILPNKFKIDKRKAHLSNLICSGQITRDFAVEELKKPAYDDAMQKSDYEFVLKKLGLTKEAFEKIMEMPPRKHTDYPVDQSIYARFPVLKMIRPLWLKVKRVRK